jgi:hypothetical protein
MPGRISRNNKVRVYPPELLPKELIVNEAIKKCIEWQFRDWWKKWNKEQLKLYNRMLKQRDKYIKVWWD